MISRVPKIEVLQDLLFIGYMDVKSGVAPRKHFFDNRVVDFALFLRHLRDFVMPKTQCLCGIFLRTSVRSHSRLGLAASLVTGPELLFLDEPFAFLDDEWRRTIAGELKTLNANEGLTILMASHELEPLERMGTEILFLNESPFNIRRDRLSKSKIRKMACGRSSR